MDLIGNCRMFCPAAAEYTFFSSAHAMFSRIDHMLGHKIRLNKFLKTEIISNIFSEHNGLKLKLNNNRSFKNCRLVQPLWKTVWQFLKDLEIEIPFDLAIPLLGIYPKKYKLFYCRDIFTSMFTVLLALFTIAKTWNQPNCPSMIG